MSLKKHNWEILFGIWLGLHFQIALAATKAGSHESATQKRPLLTQVTDTQTELENPRELYQELLALREQLSEIPLPTELSSERVWGPNTPEGKAHQLMKKMALGYAELFEVHRATPGRDGNPFPFLEGVTKIFRDRALAGIKGGVSAAERLWEQELSLAMAKRGEKQTTQEILEKLMENRSLWAARNEMGQSLPLISGSNRITDSYELSQPALFALGVSSWASQKLSNGQPLNPEDRSILSKALSEHFSHPFFEDPAKSPNSRGSLDISQIATWGKIYSIDIINQIESQPELVKSAPSILRDRKSREALKSAIQDNLYFNLKAFKKDPSMENGVGGSFFHTSLTFSALGVLKKEQIDDLFPNFRMIREEKNDGSYPYTPARGPNSGETQRSSAGRGASVSLARLLHDPSKESAEKAVEALEQFFSYSGSHKAHVAREGVHSGNDAIAPYYWAPGLQSAGKLAKLVSEKAHLLSSEFQGRLEQVLVNVNNAAKASFDPRTNVVTHPGVSTFQQTGPTFSTGLTMSALHDVDTALKNLKHSTPRQREEEPPPSSRLLGLSDLIQTGSLRTEEELNKALRQFDSLMGNYEDTSKSKVGSVFKQLELAPGSASFNLLISRVLSQANRELTPKEKGFLIELRQIQGEDLITQKTKEFIEMALPRGNH